MRAITVVLARINALATTQHVVSQVSGGGSVELSAGQSVIANAAALSAQNTLSLAAAGKILL